MPSSTRLRILLAEDVEGPKVQTIFVFGLVCIIIGCPSQLRLSCIPRLSTSVIF